MENMNAVYMEEANDLLTRLEDALLQLESNAEDMDVIEDVFRVMHTLKGNSSMFGLNEIAQFIHNLETIYDNVRERKIKITKTLLDITLKSMDHLKEIMNDLNIEDEDNKKNNSDLTQEILDFINNEVGEVVVESSSELELTQDKLTLTYHIYFKPGIQVMKNGTNPLYLLDELDQLGKCFSIPHFSFEGDIVDYDPTLSSLSWDIFLETKSDENTIKDVFVFIEDESDIEITCLASTNLLNSKEFLAEMESYMLSSERIDMNTINNYKSQVVQIEKILDKPQLKEDQPKKMSKKDKNISSIRVGSDKLDDLMNLVSELVTSQAGLSLYFEENQDDRLEVINENIEKLTRQLRDTAFSMTLVPLNNVFFRFQRLVRDLSNQLNKDVEFITDGGDTDLDKTIIDALTDPLLHLIRNCIDHGIETNEERKKLGKTEKGKISLNAYYSGANVHILIKDNGKGIDPSQIRAKAIEKGIINEGIELTRQETLDLIFSPGFSTAKEITDVSGRGVGMDVVKRNIANLRGEVHLSSELGKGTVVEIVLPLTLSIIDGLLVKLDNTHYVIPLSAVEKCHEIRYDFLHKNFNKLIELDGDQVPFLNLRSEFATSRENDPDFSQVIVIHNEEAKIGICVDEIVGEYQAVLKPVGKYYNNQEYISGATILGDGTIALVLDTFKIIEIKVKQKNLVA